MHWCLKTSYTLALLSRYRNFQILFFQFFTISRLFKFSVKTKQSKILVKYKKSSSRTKQELSEVAIFHRTCKNKERRRPNFVKIKWKIQAFSTARTDKWEKWLTSYKLFHMYSPIGKEFHSVGLYWGFV